MPMLPNTHTFFLFAYGIHLLQEVFMYTIQYTCTPELEFLYNLWGLENEEE
jgi:hypothetical protein